MVAADDRPPGTVTDVEAVATSPTSIRLTWKAPPDESPLGRAIAYDVKTSNAPIPDDAFGHGASLSGAPVPRAAGLSETLLVNVAPGSSSHYFRLRSQDASGNWSLPSNETVTRTPTSVPDSVTDVRAAAANESTLVLQWSATGDDGWVGRPARYVVALSPLPMTATEFGRSPFRYVHAATADAGAPES